MNFTLFLEFILVLAPILLLSGLIISLIKIKSLNRLERAIALYLLLGLLTDILSRLLADYWGNNLIMVPIFGIIELIIFAYIYLKILLMIKPLWLYVVVAIALIFAIFETFQSGTLTSSYCRGINSFVIVLMSLNKIYELASDSNSDNNTRVSRFNSLVLIFFSFNSLFYIPFDFLVHVSSAVKYYFWTAHIGMLIIFYINLNIFQWKAGKDLK